MKATEFLGKSAPARPAPIYALFGDELFLRRQALQAIKNLVVGDQDPAFSFGQHDGSQATFADVRDDLDMPSFTGGKRLIVVENADEFLSKNRSSLEAYIQKPSSSGVLVLPLKTLASNTRVYKLLGNEGLIECKALTANEATTWCVGQMKKAHGRELSKDCALFLVESVGMDLGILDQELAKLAVSIPAPETLTLESIQPFITRSRIDQIWKIFGMIGRGQSAEALRTLHQLFEQGEEVIKCLGAFSFQLRKIAKAHRLMASGVSQDQAMDQAEIYPFARPDALAQMRHLGPKRVRLLLSWLVEIDLGIKGGSAIPPQAQLERLLLRLAAPAEGRPLAASPAQTYRPR